MHVNARIDDKKAKAAKKAALEHDHAGWPEILDRALDLYIARFGEQAAPTAEVKTNSGSARED